MPLFIFWLYPETDLIVARDCFFVWHLAFLLYIYRYNIILLLRNIALDVFLFLLVSPSHLQARSLSMLYATLYTQDRFILLRHLALSTLPPVLCSNCSWGCFLHLAIIAHF